MATAAKTLSPAMLSRFQKANVKLFWSTPGQRTFEGGRCQDHVTAQLHIVTVLSTVQVLLRLMLQVLPTKCSRCGVQ